VEESFLQLINGNSALVYKIINAYCDDEVEKDDLYQEIIFQLWKAFPTFKGKSKMTTWMYRVALNTALTYFKKSSRTRKQDSIENYHQHFAEEMDYEEKEKLELFYNQLKKLGKVERALVMLYLDGKSYEEIAEITGLTVSNVGVKLNRTKQKLKNQLSHV
jgi:RNA polymerase sigma-70 factor (ECF subfamily)